MVLPQTKKKNNQHYFHYNKCLIVTEDMNICIIIKIRYSTFNQAKPNLVNIFKKYKRLD